MEKEFQLNRRRKGLLSFALASIGLVAGCQPWRVPNKFVTPQSNSLAKQPKSPSRAEETKETYAWYQSTKTGGDENEFEWCNDRLEEIAAEPGGASELLSYVTKGGEEKSAGATIQLARLEPGSRDVDLERIARSTSQPKTTRLAAIETLGRSPQENARERLVRIGKLALDEMPKNVAIAAEAADADRYLAAVIGALALRNESLAEFEQCMTSTGPPLTCAALITEAKQRGASPLPPSALDCSEHPQTAVRIALLRWIDAVSDIETVGEVLKITRGGQGDVFLEAVRTLGALPSSKATARLDELTRDQRPRVRGAAMAALIRQESPTATQAALSETRWQVKQAIAEFLVEPASESQWIYAEALLVDPAPAVQQTLHKTVSIWSPTAQTRARLAALESPLPFVRQTSWSTLSEKLADLPEFDPQGSPDQRNEQLARVRAALQASPKPDAAASKVSGISVEALRKEVQEWQSDNEASHKLVELRLIGLGGELTNKLDLLESKELCELPLAFWTAIAAVADPRFASACGLRSVDVAERRDAARKLAGLQGSAPPPLALLIWLEQLLAPEEDLLVWRQLLPIATHARDLKTRAAAAKIAMNALKIEAMDLRLTACSILEKAPPRAEIASALEPLLDSPGQSEVVAATRVLKHYAEMPASTQEKLSALLDSTDASVRIEAATALSMQGDSLATKMLTTAAMTGPEIERRLAIEKLGETGDDSHIPFLIGLLDATPTLRLAAIGSLEKLTAEEVIAKAEKPFMSTTEQASRWKTWYAEKKTAATKWR